MFIFQRIMRLTHILFVFILTVAPSLLTAQTLDEAKKWYLEGRFADALPVFQAEQIKTPDNPSLNQWLGASLFEVGRFSEAERYLIFASQKKIPEAYLYLGELYTKLYRFEDAEKEFEKYQRVKRRDKAALAKLEGKRDYADKMRKAINRTEDIQIIDSVIVSKEKFIEVYNLSSSSGSVIPLNAFFKNQPKTDKTLYMNERENRIYYSNGDALSGYDLFTMEKLLNEFGNEKKLPESINGDGNQAFPFVMPDGITIYFASTGHESLGGYDLFVTRYNINTDSYLAPNHLNMPFNSVFNDYMMAVDEEKGIGWFASDRFQPADSVCVYTFIPNAKVTLLESDDEAMLARRAMISRISDTWKEGMDYNSLLAKANQKTVSQQKAENEFEFVINDQSTYRSKKDFKSHQALQLFNQAMLLENQLNALNHELMNKRNQFIMGNSNDETLRASILELEARTQSISQEIEQFKIQARNEEIRNTF